MEYIIDIALGIVFILTVVISAKKGFFKTLFELLAYIIALIGAKIGSVALAEAVYSAVLKNPVQAKISEMLGDVGSVDYKTAIETLTSAIPDWADGLMKTIGIDKAQLLDQVSSAELSGSNAVESIMNKLVNPIGTAVMQTLLFVVLVFVLMIVLKFIVKILNKIIKKLPAFKQLNSGLGAVLGVLKGALVVVVIAVIISVVSGFTGSQQFVDFVDGSVIINSVKGLLASISGYAV